MSEENKTSKQDMKKYLFPEKVIFTTARFIEPYKGVIGLNKNFEIFEFDGLEPTPVFPEYIQNNPELLAKMKELAGITDSTENNFTTNEKIQLCNIMIARWKEFRDKLLTTK